MSRFLTRLLLVHGQLSTYRLSRLIKYSFYKNVAFGFLLFFYQFYNGFSGQVSGNDACTGIAGLRLDQVKTPGSPGKAQACVIRPYKLRAAC